MMLLRRCTQYASKFGKLSSGYRTGKGQFFIPTSKKGSAKESSNCHTIALISHASEVMLKILQARLQHTGTVNFQMFNLDLEKTEDRDQIANIHWIIEKAREFQSNIYLCFLDYTKPLTVWITTNYGKFFKRWECQTILPAS